MTSLPHLAQGAPLTPEQIEANFADLHPALTPAQAVIEASRCLYCYDAPCVKACPTAIDIPGFIHRIRSGNLEGSARTILSANIMGGTCGRACPTEILCEEVCVMNARGKTPIQIGQLQLHAVEHLIASGGAHPFARATPSAKSLAVVGAGPAGLSFAHRAAMLSHDVTVYEAKPKSGGLNEYGLSPTRWRTTSRRRKWNSCWASAASASNMARRWAATSRWKHWRGISTPCSWGWALAR